MIMKKNKFSFLEIKKYLKENGFIIRKRKKIKNQFIDLDVLSKTFLDSLIIISIFFITPLAINLTEEKKILSKNYEDTSKSNKKKILRNQDLKLEDSLDGKFLFEDIFTFDEQPKDSVRLSAATIEELFKSTDYNLEDVRKNKLVKPISLTLLPSEIAKIENTKKKKELFYSNYSSINY